MGLAAPSAFPLFPMAPPIPPIASFSGFLEGKLEKNHYQYTDRLVTHRSPKMCMYRYQWHGGNPPEYSPEPGFPPALIPFLSFTIQGTSKGIGRRFRDCRCVPGTPNRDRLSDPSIVFPRRCIQARGAASRPLGVFRPCGSIVRTVRHYSYRLKVNQTGLARG